MVYNIHIQINRLRLYQVNVKNPLSNKVFLDEPFDKLSNKFHRSTHKINYTVDDYKPEDYVLCLDDPNAFYYYYIIYLYKPTKKIISVEIFFRSTDKDKRYPLIFGFNHADDTSVYYTYYYIRGVKYFTGSIGSRGLITKDDLITRLIEERGLYESESYNKFIIRLGDKPNDTRPVLYPKSGHNIEMITLQKSELQEHENFVKYEHVISSKSTVESFYVSFHQDTLYMVGDSKFGKLREVEVYYNKYDGDVPVLVVFRFPSRVKLYRFSVLFSDFSSKTKNIYQLEDFSTTYLKETLIQEYKKVKKELTFKRGSAENKHISVTSERFNQGDMDIFRRAILKPNLDSSNNGHPSGPYEVYNGNLFKNYSTSKINERILSDVINKQFSSIYVYYTANNEPLLVGFIGELTNIFYRISKGGKTWEKEKGHVDVYNLGSLISKLTELESEKKGSASHGKDQPTKPSHTVAQRPTAVKPDASRTQIKPDVPKWKKPAVPKAPKVEASKPVKIDISINKRSDYVSDDVKVADKRPFGKSNLFCFFTHSHKTLPEFTISSLSYASSSIPIRSIQNLTKFRSISVYFNNNDLQKPVIIEFFQSNGQKQYFALVISNRTSYSLSPISGLQESKLLDHLINENNRINYRNTFRLDKAFEYNGISVRTNNEFRNGYTVYTHSAKGSSSKTSDVLFNNNLLVIDKSSGSSNIVQNKKYEHIKVFVLDFDLNFELLIELKESTSVTHLCRTDLAGTFKLYDSFSSTDTESVKKRLQEVYYFASTSVIVEINRISNVGVSFPYEMKLSNNKLPQDKHTLARTDLGSMENTSPLKKVKIVEETLSCRTEKNTSIKCYSHDISELDLASQKRKISGLKLYLPKTFSRFSEMVEVELYNDTSTDLKDRHYIYFLSDSSSVDIKKKVYVYFFHQDPRPLLIKYDNSYYRPSKDNNHKWYHDTTFDSKDDCTLLSNLTKIHKEMRNKLIFVKLGDSTNLSLLRNTTLGNFKKDTYAPDIGNKDHQLFTLPKNVLINKEPTERTNLDVLFDQLYTKDFDTVNVYSNQSGTSLKDINLFEFINESHKIHIKRRDKLGNYWVEELIQKNDDKGLQDELKSIETSIDDIIVYEIDKTNTNYNSRVQLTSQAGHPAEGFNKYTHRPTTSANRPKKTLILCNGTKLVKMDGNRFSSLDEIEYKNFNAVTVYSISDSYENKFNFPVLIELNSSNSGRETNVYYYHRRKDSNHFWDKIDFSSSISFNEALIDKLYEAKFELLDSIVLLMDKREERYGGPEIIDAIKVSGLTKDINLADLDIKNISIVKSGSVRCISKYGFRAYEHDLSRVQDYFNYGLRFFILESVNGSKYVELSLYNQDGETKEYIFFNPKHKTAYFFYYGEDPRPLLLFYGDKAYRAFDIENYNSHMWFRDNTITDAFCKYGRDNSDLIYSLCDVVGFLNQVNILLRPEYTGLMEPNEIGVEKKVYYSHSSYNYAIRINVTYENKSCYRVYRHESYGLQGHGHGFRLGNITIGYSPDLALNYDASKQLTCVSVYYNLFDINHSHPILVSLRYADYSYEYYELLDYSPFRWRRIDSYVDENSVEDKAYEILKKLNIEFDRKDEVLTLFNRDACKEGGNNAAVIGGSVGGVVGSAAVGVGVTAAAHPEWFVPVIQALV